MLAACFGIYGAQAFAGFVQLFPLWLDAARHARYGNLSFVWVELVSSIAAVAAAYGLWRQRRWARTPTVVVVVLATVTGCWIVAFGLADVANGRVWFVVGVLALVALVLAAWLLRYVWRQT
jgi:hypothetical protein